MKGLKYIIQKKVYISLTNECNSVSLLHLKGPKFFMPVSANFTPLPHGYEPTSKEIFDVIDGSFERGEVKVDSMESDVVTYSGIGEPLLRLGVLTDSASMITENRHGAQLRVMTNGLIPSKNCSNVRLLILSIQTNNLLFMSTFLLFTVILFL